jgi:hypothetical protein
MPGKFFPPAAAKAAAMMADEDVRWTSLVNTTATGNSIRKTGGANDGRYDGSGVSQQTITSNGYYEFRAAGVDVERVTGLTDTPTNNAPDSLDFYVNLSEGGIAEFRERGVYLSDTTYVNGDTFRITLVNGRAQYSKNGVVLATGNVVLTTALNAIATFSLLNGEVGSARLGNVSGGGCTYSLAQTSANVPATESGVGINVTTGAACRWTIASNAAWITINGASSFTGSGTANLRVLANAGAARTGTVTVAGQTFTVNQAAGTTTCVPPTVTISPGRQRVCEQNAWSFTATVTAGTGPFAYQWFKDGVAIPGATGTTYGKAAGAANLSDSGNYSVRVTNACGTATSTNAPGQLTVVGLIGINPTSANYPVTGGNGRVALSTGVNESDNSCGFVVTASPSWVTGRDDTPSNGPGVWAYTVAANTGAARTGIVTFSNPRGTRSYNFTITQAGSGGGGGNVQDVIWTQLQNATATGGTIRKTSGANDGTYDGGGVSQQMFANNGYYEFTAGGADVERVTGLTDTPTNRDFTSFDFYVNLSEGGIAEFRERGQYLSDTVYRNGDVFRITVENGRARYSKNGVTLANGTAFTSAPLKAMAALSLLNGEIAQAKLGGLTGGCSFAISPMAATVQASGGSGTVAVTAPGGCTWTAGSNASSWLTIASGVSGNGNGSVGYRAAANTGAQRTGTLTIAGQTFTVTQLAATQNSPDITWTRMRNVTLIGKTLRKTGGANDGTYDGEAVSQELLVSGTGYLEFTVSGSFVRRSIGFSPNFTPGQPDTIDYQLNLSDSDIIEFRYRGQYIADAIYRIGDTIRLAVENGRIVAYVNARAFAETTVRPSYPLYVWASFSRHGGEISNAKLFTGQLPTLQQRRTPFDIYNDLPDDDPEALPGQRRRREQP